MKCASWKVRLIFSILPSRYSPHHQKLLIIFPNIKAFGKTSQAFAEELLENAGVVTVPGSAFGDMGEGYLRLVFANSDENLKEAVRRIADYVARAYPGIK